MNKEKLRLRDCSWTIKLPIILYYIEWISALLLIGWIFFFQ